MQIKYTPEINQFIIANRQDFSIKELLQLIRDNFDIQVTQASLQSHLSRKLKLKGPEKKFSAELNHIIRKTTTGRTINQQIQEIKALTGETLSPNQVKGARRRLGLKSGVDLGFKPGGIPANKGKGMSPEQREKCARTWFPKNHSPANKVPVGTRRYRKGYWWEKIAEPNKWKQIHVLEWEKHHGPKPKSSIIAFLDGDTSNWHIENLELVTRADWATCSKFYPLEKGAPDFNRLSITAARLRRTAKARERDLKEETK